MNILVLPVSGGGFVVQLAILQHLAETKYIPDVTLACSGGNVAAYTAAAANWKKCGIERIARELSHNLFVTPWYSNSLLAFVIGFFQGNVYATGSGAHSFLARYFDSRSVAEHEIWTGTYNRKEQKSRLFCNRSRGASRLDPDKIEYELTQSMAPYFADGDIETIAQYILASASIPAIVPAQVIEGDQYIDGGIAGASPLTVMHRPILDYVERNQTTLHLIYVNSIDLDQPVTEPCHNVVDNWRQATQDLVRSQTVIDRLSAYELLKFVDYSTRRSSSYWTQPSGTDSSRSGGEIRIERVEFPCSYDNLILVDRVRNLSPATLLEIYPSTQISVDLGKFTGDDVVGAIRRAYRCCRCRFFWVDTGNPEIKESLTQCQIAVCLS